MRSFPRRYDRLLCLALPWLRPVLLGSIPLVLGPPAVIAASTGADNLGVFSGQTDVGEVAREGTAVFDSGRGHYTIGGSGENMWGEADAFHYVWAQRSGDVALAANIAFVGESAQPHRKACLVFRQSLDAASVYVDVAVHGDGLTSLQFRDTEAGPTREVQANVAHPRRVRLEKIGGTVHLSLAAGNGEVAPAGCSVDLRFTDPFYVGLAVCAHDNAAFETATFSEVVLGAPASDVARVRSSLETIAIASGDRRSIFHSEEVIEAPNWSHTVPELIYNGGGRLFRIGLEPGARPTVIDTGSAVRCNNDHGISPDGTRIVISDQTEDGRSIIYTLPYAGGTPQRVTPESPSYWHGWSPDGKTLAYCAERNGEFDIYTIPAGGGQETRLTTAPGLDDGPDYSPDGHYIYFNSLRTGTMQIWRMRADGSEQTQITSDGFNDWFPHPSPDGRWIVFLSYGPEVTGHPPDQDVRLRLLALESGEIRELARFNGGQGTINVPSWSADSARLAYVRYQKPAAR